MKQVIFIGQTGCGKTTLCQKLNEQRIRYKKTQAVEFYGTAIDTPGEYMENPRFYNALHMTSADARIVALISDPTRVYQAIPPAFAGSFAKKVIGIVTKIDIAKQEAVEKAVEELKRANAEPVFLVDTIAGIGMEELEEFLEREVCAECQRSS